MSMKGRSPNKEEKIWMSKIIEQGCIVCRLEHDVYTPAEVHHIDGKVKPQAHLKTLALCPNHHRMGLNNELIVSRHPYKAEFVKRYGTEIELLNKLKDLVWKSTRY